jgi:hypothetical protein
MAKTRKMVVYKRRLEVKKLYLQAKSVTEIATELQTSESIIQTDLREINKWYLDAVQNNPNIVEKQAEYMLKHLDELNLIKQKLWELERDSKCDKDKIGACKALLDELQHESKVLKLIDVSKAITNYIHIDKINVLAKGVIDVIKEFVPVEKQKYALERLKIVSDNVIDTSAKEITNEQK